MDWIEVPIFCNTNKTSEFKDLGIECNYDDFEIRMGMIDVDKIIGFYPTSKNETTIIHLLSGESFEVNVKYSVFKNILKKPE